MSSMTLKVDKLHHLSCDNDNDHDWVDRYGISVSQMTTDRLHLS